MAKYQYACSKCETEHEVTRPISEPEGKYPCPGCGYLMVRVYTPTAVSFKGGGFYKTDSRNKA